ncbi:MAG: alpha/beta hydrolase [Bryobacterales bacterium]|nr:alpha/beta hydrolase [Bryobacterales bacterium]
MIRKLFIAALGALLLSSIAIAAPPPPAGWSEGFVIANGIRIHYWRSGGEKPAMVMAHGSSDNGLCWTNFAKEFAADYDIVMFDARGHGFSDPPSAGDPPDAQAEDLAALIRELKLQKPVVMGHSMGSASTAWFAAKYPGVPSAIVLEDPFLGARRANTGGSTEERRSRILETNNKSEAELVAQCMKNSPQWGKSECEIWAPSKRMHHPNTAFGNLGSRPAMSELFEKITAPTLILKADADATARAENEKVAAMLAKGKIVHIDGAGHNVRRDRKAETVAALKAFLKGV